MCTICACYITALAYYPPIKYWLCIHLTLVFGDPIASGQWRPCISMHLQYISFVYYTYYFSLYCILISSILRIYLHKLFLKPLKNKNNIFLRNFLVCNEIHEIDLCSKVLNRAKNDYCLRKWKEYVCDVSLKSGNPLCLISTSVSWPPFIWYFQMRTLRWGW